MKKSSFDNVPLVPLCCGGWSWTAAAAEGALTETILLKVDLVKHCLGCHTCHKKRAFPQKDGFEDIKAKDIGRRSAHRRHPKLSHRPR